MPNKYTYMIIIQQHTVEGWEDVDGEDLANPGALKRIRINVREYRANQPEYPVRTIHRRVRKQP